MNYKHHAKSNIFLTADASSLDNVVSHVVWMSMPSHKLHSALHPVRWALLAVVNALATVPQCEQTNRLAMHSPFSRAFWIRNECWP